MLRQHSVRKGWAAVGLVVVLLLAVAAVSLAADSPAPRVTTEAPTAAVPVEWVGPVQSQREEPAAAARGLVELQREEEAEPVKAQPAWTTVFGQAPGERVRRVSAVESLDPFRSNDAVADFWGTYDSGGQAVLEHRMTARHGSGFRKRLVADGGQLVWLELQQSPTYSPRYRYGGPPLRFRLLRREVVASITLATWDGKRLRRIDDAGAYENAKRLVIHLEFNDRSATTFPPMESWAPKRKTTPRLR